MDSAYVPTLWIADEQMYKEDPIELCQPAKLTCTTSTSNVPEIPVTTPKYYVMYLANKKRNKKK